VQVLGFSLGCVMSGANDGPVRAERLFVAVPLAEEVRGGLQAHIEAALGGQALPGRPVPPRNWHFTLRFLGDTQPEDAARLREELRRSALGPAFAVGFGRLGAFPRPARGSVVWIGVAEGADALRGLAGEVEQAAVRAGFAREPKPFAPHLTLARVQPPRDVRPVLAKVPPFAGRMDVEQVVLYRSQLGNGPPRYDAVERFTLG
jgi:2'-5' RNA ligase